jgi:hypothetical protein
MPGRRESGPACRLPDFRRRSGCVPAEPYPPLKQPMRLHTIRRMTRCPKHYSTFDRTALSTFARTTTAIMRGEALNYPYAPATEHRRCGIFSENQAVQNDSSIGKTYSGDAAPTELVIIWQGEATKISRLRRWGAKSVGQISGSTRGRGGKLI